MSKKPSSPGARKRNLWVIIVAVLVVLATALLAVTVSLQRGQGSASESYRHVSFTDATVRCQQEARDDFGSELKQLALDRHSSRYDDAQNAYLVFMRVDMPGKNFSTLEYFVDCYVSARSGKITKYDVHENLAGAKKSEAIRKGGDKLIEWPQ